MGGKEKDIEVVSYSLLVGTSCIFVSEYISNLSGVSNSLVTMFGIGITTACSYLVINSYKDKQSIWNKIIRNCKMTSTDGKSPKLISKVGNNLGIAYTFALPIGLNEGCFYNNRASIRCALKKDVLITYKGNMVTVQAIEGG